MDHGDLNSPPKFKLKVIGSFRDALTRQISESVRIDLRGGGALNSKNEYSRCRIPRLTIDMEGWKIMKKKEKERLQLEDLEQRNGIQPEGILESGVGSNWMEKKKRKEKERKAQSAVSLKDRD